MKKIAFAGAIALGLMFLLPATGGTAVAAESQIAGELSQINIPRIKATLKLTAAQLPHWRAVEAALRDLQRSQKLPADSLIKRVGNRVASAVSESAALAKLAAAARPLVKAMDDEQKMIAMQLVQDMGLGKVLASLI